ncbi:hypothetical protein [Dickeya sp. Secpp 1600]|uniref:hypothetical protein n=1 Tax=Dickeya sp. Secpp 1600 TaxID=2037915 RepID=UPI00131F02C4|nr:hypothetical protein [Dickeya sp. Secpp 1600]
MSGHQGSTLAFDKRSIKVNRPYPAAAPMLAPMAKYGSQCNAGEKNVTPAKSVTLEKSVTPAIGIRQRQKAGLYEEMRSGSQRF